MRTRLSVILPLLSVITSISWDHIEVLGNIFESIAEEKAGIIKPGIPVVIGPKVPFNIIERKAEQLNSPILQVTEKGATFEIENQLIAKEALKYLAQSTNLTPETIIQGLNSKPPCRLETISDHPLFLLDVASNPDGIQSLLKALHVKFPGKKFNLLFGLCKNKDISACVSILAERAQKFYPVEAANGRGWEAEKLTAQLKKCGVDPSRIFNYSNRKESIEQARLHAEKEDQILLVCGTFFIMDEVKKSLRTFFRITWTVPSS